MQTPRRTDNALLPASLDPHPHISSANWQSGLSTPIEYVPECCQNLLGVIRLDEPLRAQLGTGDSHYAVHANPNPAALVEHIAHIKRQDGSLGCHDQSRVRLN